MPSRPDIRDLASNVREAFSDCERDQLLDILTFVLKEYVVEGPPPMLIHQAETLADLKGASFAQLITAMQTRFDFPELAMFQVDGEQVSVRVGGVVQPLLASRQPPAGVQMVDTRPQAGVRVVETPLQQRPANAAPPPGPIGRALDAAATERSGNERPSAPPPTRGLSLRGRPAGEAGAPAPAPPPAAARPPEGATPPAAAPPAAAPPAAAPPEPKKDTSDDATARFSLLELD